MVKITLCSIIGMINKKVLNNHKDFEMKFWELPKTANWLDYSYNCHIMVNSKQFYYTVNTHIVQVWFSNWQLDIRLQPFDCRKIDPAASNEYKVHECIAKIATVRFVDIKIDTHWVKPYNIYSHAIIVCISNSNTDKWEKFIAKQD